MNTSSPTHRLQQTADYRTVRKTLKGSAIVSVVGGAITLLVALLPPFDALAAFVGLVLLGTGVWNLMHPRPIGLALDGASVILVGITNIAGTALAMSAGESTSGVWARVGIFQILWGAQALWRWTQFRNAFERTPSDTEMRQLDEMATALWKAKPKESLDVVEFKLTGFTEVPWKCRLTDTHALLATAGGTEVKVAAREEIEIADQGKVLIGSARKATFTIRGKTVKGTIPAESLERFQQWKTGIVRPRAIAA